MPVSHGTMGTLSLDVYLVATHLPGVLNGRLDFLSRGGTQNHEWTLNLSYLEPVFWTWESPEIDVFATRRNLR